MTSKLPFVFFGTPALATVFLDDLEAAGLVPALVVTAPDAPRGRGMKLASPPVKEWAFIRSIEVLQPEKLDAEFSSQLEARSLQLFVVIYYGKILPKAILDIPKHGALNIHFSLLPRWRGTSPVRAAILNDDREIGASIMLLDEKIDHGPIVAQKKISVPNWPVKASELEERLTRESARLLVEILPSWISNSISAHEQNHDLATHCPTLAKKDGLIRLADDSYKNVLKIRAFDTTIGTYALFERGPSTDSTSSPQASSGQAKTIRVQILDAHLENEKLVIDRVKPEGKREMTYDEFQRSGARPV